VTTKEPISAHVLEPYVRRPNADRIEVISGEKSIRRFLDKTPRSVPKSGILK
jgi:hypothetical protein